MNDGLSISGASYGVPLAEMTESSAAAAYLKRVSFCPAFRVQTFLTYMQALSNEDDGFLMRLIKLVMAEFALLGIPKRFDVQQILKRRTGSSI